MTNSDGTPQWEQIQKEWSTDCTFEHDPGQHPDGPYAAHSRDGQATLRAASLGELLDQIKDAAAVPVAQPRRHGERGDQ